MGADVGLRVPYELFQQDPSALRACVQRAETAGLDRLTIGDHVSFHGGQGFDGLLQAAVLAGLTTRATVQTGVYLLALRHPVPTARQVATVANLAAGGFVLGVGLGGEDRHELEICGVDPRTRGARLDECLAVVRALLAGDAVDHHGRFFQFEGARILPSPRLRVPIVVGGRSEATVRRIARYGDGWLGLFVSPRRYGEVVGQIDDVAAVERRPATTWYHGMHFWCSFDESPDRVARAMEALYELPFERFERYTLWGDPAEVAERVRPYLDAGAAYVNLAPVCTTTEETVDGAAEVRRLLAAAGAPAPGASDVAPA
jgi:alkanesulfonate monooxygenase SsuD/methylene tetrahydromethanopterin reductase-like flavin-dependent oxidoreductase (luciferase family)